MAIHPERKQVIRDISAQRDASPKPLRVKCLRITGSNAEALQGRDAAKPQSDSVDTAKPSATVSHKRSRDTFEQDNSDAAFDRRLRRHVPPVFPPPPIPSNHTIYLTDLLQNWPLRLTLQQKSSKKCAPVASTQNYQITSIGLLVTEVMRQMGLPVLSMPTLEQARSLASDCLSAAQKYDIARQIRKLVTQLRKTPPKNVQLGSTAREEYSLLLDKHQSNTYWAVRRKPTHRMFVAFLMSSFHATVPGSVAAALSDQLKREAPLVMSHGEICPRNILVDNYKVIAIMGWGCAGWYPDWWEYVKFFEARTSDKNSDWYEYASEIFTDEFPAELAAYQGIVRCQAP
ncbi:hypothetical protein ED733_007685 [Metarhizium rileyi]|uniref:Aminoglycoside phosphotransferase domain-containing protein n=1 Tax=Metarhizium rileyi (strain RCEF 4871) TaxID=1649241 RepID=A0A5C6GHS9_METRR|nr:hypothetical protein ED733_007685 [Metarhizium rileyi]